MKTFWEIWIQKFGNCDCQTTSEQLWSMQKFFILHWNFTLHIHLTLYFTFLLRKYRAAKIIVCTNIITARNIILEANHFVIIICILLILYVIFDFEITVKWERFTCRNIVNIIQVFNWTCVNFFLSQINFIVFF